MAGYDAIVIGAGQNGLACACYLARAGLKVVVVEQYGRVGGMTLTEELTLPGFRSDVHATGYQLANLSPTPMELSLADYGLELIEPNLVYCHAFPDGRSITVSRDLGPTLSAIDSISKHDAVACRQLFEQYRSEKEEIVAALFSPPPSLADLAAAQADTRTDAYRFNLQSVRSWADERFVSDEVKSLFGTFAAFVGAAPDDGGGARIAWLFATVLQDAGNNLVKGGMNNLSLALAGYLKDHGGEIRTGARADRILVEDERAVAVRLHTGEQLIADQVVAASVDPRELVVGLLGEQIVGSEIARKMASYEWGDATLVLYVALDGPVDYKAGAGAGAAAHVHLTPPSLESMAQAAVECRAGKLPAQPVVVSWNEGVIDPSRTPPGKDLKKFVVLGVPYRITGDATGTIDGRSWDHVKDRYAEYLLDLIARDYLPGLKSRIVAVVAHSPLDIERKLSSAVQGTISHGAMVPYQLGPMRPIPELGHYRSPIANVYLCGSGTHPGAGVSMASGRNAAQVISADLGLGSLGVAPFPPRSRAAR